MAALLCRLWLHCCAGCALYETTARHTQAAQCEWHSEPSLKLCRWGSNNNPRHSNRFLSNGEGKGTGPAPPDGCWLMPCPPVPWCLLYAELPSHLTSRCPAHLHTDCPGPVSFLLVLLPAALQRSSTHDHCCLASPAFVSSLSKVREPHNYSLEK